VWCREDEITPLKWGEDYSAAVSGARLVVLNGCGHFPNLEQPNDFNRTVLEFLQQLKASP
jgi:pimeloyl-ACP methyl ester carboxylesterase